MVDFLIFCMATVGLTAILVDGKIFAPLREQLENHVRAQEERQQASIASGGTKRRTWSGFLLDILTCYQCCGFWSGLFCGLILTISQFYMNSLLAAKFGEWHQFGKCGTVLFLHFYAALFWLMCGLVGSFLATVYLMIVELVFAKTMLCRRTHPEPSEDHVSHDESEHEEKSSSP